MSETDRVETVFSGGAEVPELEHYRPISTLVIMACVAGLASLLAVVHPVLWVVPAVAVVLSVCAIVRLSSPQSRYGGRNAAIAALCVAVLIGSYAPARTLSRDRVLYAEARARIDEWLALIQQGRIHEAHQLMKDPSERFQGPGSLASHYSEVPAEKPLYNTDGIDVEAPPGASSPAEQLKELTMMPPLAKLMELGERARIEHLQNVGMRFEYGDMKITHRYRVISVQDGKPESIEFSISATRHEEEKLANWKVGDLGLVQ